MFYRSKIADSCVKGLTLRRYLKIDWTIGTGLNQLSNCCKRRFMMVYEVTKSNVETLCKAIKNNQYSVNNSYCDRSAAIPITTIKAGLYLEQLKDLCKQHDIALSHEQVVMSVIILLLFYYSVKEKYLFY